MEICCAPVGPENEPPGRHIWARQFPARPRPSIKFSILGFCKKERKILFSSKGNVTRACRTAKSSCYTKISTFVSGGRIVMGQLSEPVAGPMPGGSRADDRANAARLGPPKTTQNDNLTNTKTRTLKHGNRKQPFKHNTTQQKQWQIKESKGNQNKEKKERERKR